MTRCPRCGSPSLSGNKKVMVGKGLVGGLAGTFIAGPTGLIGLTAGNMGAKKVTVTCMKCGKRFKA